MKIGNKNSEVKFQKISVTIEQKNVKVRQVT